MREDDATPRGHSSAYPFAADRYKYSFMMIMSVLMMIWIKGAIHRDYRDDAETFLKTHGREDALEKVMPLSNSEMVSIEKELSEKNTLEKNKKEEEDKTTIEFLLSKTVALETKIAMLEKIGNNKDSEIIASLEKRVAFLEEANGGMKSIENKINTLEKETNEIKTIENKIIHDIESSKDSNVANSKNSIPTSTLSKTSSQGQSRDAAIAQRDKQAADRVRIIAANAQNKEK